MLVLSRKVGEAICIGDHIVITVNRTSGNRVTLGIEAPSDVRVDRKEVADRILAETAGQPQGGPAIA